MSTTLLAADAGLTIVGLGKFGGREITYGADLDVLFVGENARAAQSVFVTMGKPTPEGTISPLDTASSTRWRKRAARFLARDASKRITKVARIFGNCGP